MSSLATSLQATCDRLAAENFQLQQQIRNAESSLASLDNIGRIDALLSSLPTCILCIDRILPATSEISLHTRLNALGALRRTAKVDLFCRHDPIQSYLGSVAVLVEFGSIPNAEFALRILQDQKLAGQQIRARFAREFPTTTIAAFGAICALPEAVLRPYFSKFGIVRKLIMNSPIAEGWILITFQHLHDAVNCLIMIRHKIIAGSLIEAHFANQTEIVDLDDDYIGETDPISEQIQKFDGLRSTIFNGSDCNHEYIISRNNRIFSMIEKALESAEDHRTQLSLIDCLRLYLTAENSIDSLTGWIVDNKIEVIYKGADEEQTMALLQRQRPLHDRDVRFYIKIVEELQEVADRDEMVNSMDLNRLMPYSDLTARKMSIGTCSQLGFVLYLNRAQWMRPRAMLLYWVMNLNSNKQPQKSDRIHIQHVLRFALYNAALSEVEYLTGFVLEAGRSVDEFTQRCELIPSTFMYFIVAGAGHVFSDSKPNSSLVFEDVGRRWLDFRHRLQYAGLPLYDQSPEWPGQNIMKRAEAFNKVLQASQKSGRQAFRAYARLMCYIDDCIRKRLGTSSFELIADLAITMGIECKRVEAMPHQSFESRVLLGLSQVHSRRLRSHRRPSSTSSIRSNSSYTSLSAASLKGETLSVNAKFDWRMSLPNPRPKKSAAVIHE